MVPVVCWLSLRAVSVCFQIEFIPLVRAYRVPTVVLGWCPLDASSISQPSCIKMARSVSANEDAPFRLRCLRYGACQSRLLSFCDVPAYLHPGTHDHQPSLLIHTYTRQIAPITPRWPKREKTPQQVAKHKHDIDNLNIVGRP